MRINIHIHHHTTADAGVLRRLDSIIQKLDEISNNPNIKYCYIIKGSYYRPNSCGYTSLKFEAGVYPKDEAVSHAKSVREIRLEWVYTWEHNKMINQKIAELQARLL